VKNKSYYILGYNSSTVYGPYDSIESFSNGAGYMAYTLPAGDSLKYYINGRHIATAERFGYLDSLRDRLQNWCIFNSKGSYLYTIKKGKWSYLYANDRLVDSTRYFFGWLWLDEDNNYFYFINEVDKETRFRLKPRVHPPQQVCLMPRIQFLFQKVLTYDNNDTVYYFGNADGKNYFDPPPFDKPVDSFEVGVLMSGNTIFEYQLSERQTGYRYGPVSEPKRICINGNCKDLPYQEILLPCIDSRGNYALFGLRDYYLYKYVNGIEEPAPLSKHGVRAKPLSIDVIGNTICYYETDDSVYVYQDDSLFRKCAAWQFDLDETTHIWRNDWLNEKLPVFHLGENTYIVYNNRISPPLFREKRTPYTDSVVVVGDIMHTGINDHGYWLLQKTGQQKYDLLVNNRKVQLPPGVNLENPLYGALASNFRLNGDEFIFYTQEGTGIYRYNLKL
ncbi:MAG: hypothetical protein K8F30_04505, partial [Taibaiella sp.]|nr:hypothetical protein [Taibaiella sp.]